MPKGQHPLFEAWETIYCRELPGNTFPSWIARAFVDNPHFSEEELGACLFARCLKEVITNKDGFYPEEVVVYFVRLFDAFREPAKEVVHEHALPGQSALRRLAVS